VTFHYFVRRRNFDDAQPVNGFLQQVPLAQFHAEEIPGFESGAGDLMLVSYSFRGTLKVSSSSAIWKIAAKAVRLTEPSDEEIRLRAYFISEHRHRFALPGDADSDWREAKQQLLSESVELSGRSTITTEEPSEIPARTEEITLPAVVTAAETEVGPIEEGQPASHGAYRKAESNGELPPLTESVFESPVGPAVEQTAETLRPSVPQRSDLAPALAAVPMPPEAARLTEPSDEEIRLRAYFISEDRRRFALPGDADSDWHEAKQQFLSESVELSGRSTITTEEPSEIPARTEEIALPAAVTSAETEVGPIEEGQPASHEAYRKAEPNGELPPLIESVFESPVGPAVEQAAETLRPSVPQTPEIAPALAAVPMPPEAARLTEPSDEETLEIPARTEEIAPPAVVTSAETEVGSMQTSVQLTFSYEVAAMELTPTFKIGVLQVRPISKIVTMRLAPSQQVQVEGSFEIAKIQPVGKTLGTIRVTPSQQQRPSVGSRSFMAAGLQFVPNGEPLQFMPSQHGQAAVFVTVPCQITTIEFSPLLEIASVVLNSSSIQVLVQLPGAGLSPADQPLMFEIADLQLSESGNADMIQLNLLGQSPTGT
jgi:hypothetical protein